MQAMDAGTSKGMLQDPVKTPPDWQAMARVSLSLSSVFVFYASCNSLLTAMLTGRLGTTAVGQRPFAMQTGDLEHVLFWGDFAVLGAFVALCIIGWSLVQLRTALVRRSFWSMIGMMAVLSVFALYMNMSRSIVMVELPQRLTCPAGVDLAAHPILPADLYASTAVTVADLSNLPADDWGDSEPAMIGNGPGFACDYDSTLGWQSGSHVDASRLRVAVRAVKARLHQPEDWFGRIVWLKKWLNWIFEVAAIVVLGTMLAIAAVCHKTPPTELGERLCERRTIPKLFIASGVVLSAITLTDCIFANWPIAAAGLTLDAKPNAAAVAEMTRILSALVLYYAVLGSATIALTVMLAGGLALKSVREVTADDGDWLGTMQKLMLNKTMLNALVALSPVLTTLVGMAAGRISP